MGQYVLSREGLHGGCPAAPDTVTLNNGVTMPMVALGVGGYNTTQATEAIKLALSLGFTSIDTAHDYGNNPGVAAAIKGVDRKSFFLTTKVPGCGVPTQGIQPPCYNNTLKLARENLAAMGTS